MIYLFENLQNNASTVLDGRTLTEAEKLEAVQVESLPIAEHVEGKVAHLKVRKATGEVWYEYSDKPVDEATEIAELKTRLQSTEDALVFLMDMQMMGGM